MIDTLLFSEATWAAVGDLKKSMMLFIALEKLKKGEIYVLIEDFIYWNIM